MAPRLADHLHLLVCPVCHGELELRGDTVIACLVCGRLYPIVDGLPVLLATRVLTPDAISS